MDHMDRSGMAAFEQTWLMLLAFEAETGYALADRERGIHGRRLGP